MDCPNSVLIMDCPLLKPNSDSPSIMDTTSSTGKHDMQLLLLVPSIPELESINKDNGNEARRILKSDKADLESFVTIWSTSLH